MSRAGPFAPGRCDLCGAAMAPFGFRVIGAGNRPLRSCSPCRAAAEARFQTALSRFSGRNMTQKKEGKAQFHEQDLFTHKNQV